MRINIQRFAPELWATETFFKDYKYNSKGELTQITVRIESNYNLTSIYDIDNEGNESWAYGLWDIHDGVGSYPYSEIPYIERTFKNLNNLKGVKVSCSEFPSKNQCIYYNFKMTTEEPATTTYLTKTSATAVLKGNVLDSLNTYDHNNAPSVAAVRNYLDSGGIVRQSDVENIVSQAVSNALLAAHPIGSIEINVSGTNPETYLGGTWEAFGVGRTLIGVGTGTDTNGTKHTFSSAELTGGEYTHKLTVTEMPKHKHDINRPRWWTAEQSSETGGSVYASTATRPGAVTKPIGEAGGNGYHNNLEPYITVYFWKRIA